MTKNRIIGLIFIGIVVIVGLLLMNRKNSDLNEVVSQAEPTPLIEPTPERNPLKFEQSEPVAFSGTFTETEFGNFTFTLPETWKMGRRVTKSNEIFVSDSPCTHDTPEREMTKCKKVEYLFQSSGYESASSSYGSNYPRYAHDVATIFGTDYISVGKDCSYSCHAYNPISVNNGEVFLGDDKCVLISNRELPNKLLGEEEMCGYFYNYYGTLIVSTVRNFWEAPLPNTVYLIPLKNLETTQLVFSDYFFAGYGQSDAYPVFDDTQVVVFQQELHSIVNSVKVLK